MGFLLSQNQTTINIPFLMVDSTDHVTGKTGLSPVVTISKNGGAFATPSGAVTEIGNGVYQLAGNATDADTLGALVLHAEEPGTAGATDPFDDLFLIVAFNPLSSVDLGLSLVPSNLTQLNGAAQSLLDLKDFADAGYDPDTNKVNGVKLVDTTTTNSDMRGTDGANTVVPLDSGSTATLNNQTSILNRIGAFTGSGINTILGFFQSLFRSNIGTDPSDIGGTFDSSTDSLQAIRDRGDAAWISGSFLTQSYEDSETLQDFFRLARAALVGKISGADTGTVLIKSADGTKDRITATVDASGNRITITTDLT